MNILINYDLESCAASISADSTLTEVAFAIDSVTSHFLGRGVNRFDCTRTKQQNGNCVLNFKALKKSGPMVLSKVASIGFAVAEKIFPRDILDVEKFELNDKGFEKVVLDGQHKHGSIINKKDGGNTISIVESFVLRPELPFSILTYGLGDLFTGLFVLNCNYLKWQGSLNKVQLYIRHNLTDKELSKFILSDEDYDVLKKVSTLS